MGIKIRKAEPQDSRFIAWAMLASSRAGKRVGIFDLIFESSDDTVLLEKMVHLTQTPTKSHCHYTNFLVAFDDEGKQVGALCGFEPRIANHERFSKALEEIGVDESYNERIAAYLLCQYELDRQTWVLDFMQVNDEAYTLSVLKELVQKSLLTARLKGYRKVETMIEIGSSELLLVYEKLGFFYIDEKQSDYYFESFGRKGIMRLGMHL